jgi:hypothetical protein
VYLQVVNDQGPSEEILVLFQRLQQALTKEERIRLTSALALQFIADYDPSDPSATDELHDYFNRFAKVKLAYDQAVLQIGRLAVDCIGAYLESEEATVEDAMTIVRKSVN